MKNNNDIRRKNIDKEYISRFCEAIDSNSEKQLLNGYVNIKRIKRNIELNQNGIDTPCGKEFLDLLNQEKLMLEQKQKEIKQNVMVKTVDKINLAAMETKHTDFFELLKQKFSEHDETINFKPFLRTMIIKRNDDFEIITSENIEKIYRESFESGASISPVIIVAVNGSVGYIVCPKYKEWDRSGVSAVARENILNPDFHRPEASYGQISADNGKFSFNFSIGAYIGESNEQDIENIKTGIMETMLDLYDCKVQKEKGTDAKRKLSHVSATRIKDITSEYISD